MRRRGFKGGIECGNRWKETDWGGELLQDSWSSKCKGATTEEERMKWTTCRRCLFEECVLYVVRRKGRRAARCDDCDTVMQELNKRNNNTLFSLQS